MPRIPAGVVKGNPQAREILESFFAGMPIRPECLIVKGGKLAGTGATSYQK